MQAVRPIFPTRLQLPLFVSLCAVDFLFRLPSLLVFALLVEETPLWFIWWNSMFSIVCFDLFYYRSADVKKKTMCCIVKLMSQKMDELIKMYHKKHWLDKKGESVAGLCFISRIKVAKPGTVSAIGENIAWCCPCFWRRNCTLEFKYLKMYPVV